MAEEAGRGEGIETEADMMPAEAMWRDKLLREMTRGELIEALEWSIGKLQEYHAPEYRDDWARGRAARVMGSKDHRAPESEHGRPYLGSFLGER